MTVKVEKYHSSSFWFDAQDRTRLQQLSEFTRLSKSEIVRALIQAYANGDCTPVGLTKIPKGQIKV